MSVRDSGVVKKKNAPDRNKTKRDDYFVQTGPHLEEKR